MSISVIFVGRLDEEKGIKHLIFALNHLLHKKIPLIAHIYGDGHYKEKIIKLTQTYPDNVFYYGRQKKNEIVKTWKTMDYFVMPSQFLETFGLTACESLLCGVPVIGNKKGGLEAFIDDRLNIQQQIGSHDGEKLATLLEYLSTQKLQKNDFSDMMDETKRRYSKETRYRQIASLFPTNNTIHIISDYTNYNGGGIETHIHDSITILQSHKHNIQLQGHQAPTGKRATLKKLTIMAKSRCNISDAYKVWNISSSTTIRWHSISRVIGRLPILIAGERHQIITHHELGLFHPYPSKTTQINQLPKARSRKAFVQAGKPKHRGEKLLITGKYILIWLIHKQLQTRVKTHIVPSAWMIPMVRARHPDTQILCIPHFVDMDNT